MAMENPPCLDDFSIEAFVYMGFPIAMFDYQRVNHAFRVWGWHEARPGLLAFQV